MAEKKELGYEAMKTRIADGQIGNVYVFCGEESYLREYCLRELKKSLVPAGFDEFNYHRFHGGDMTMQELSEAVEAMPMMAERTLTVVEDCDLFRMDDGERTALLSLLSDFPDYACLVFVYDTLEYKPNKTYKKLCEALSAHAEVVRFEAQSRNDLIRWITRHFRAAGQEIAPQACEHLIFSCGELMTGLLPEIEKVSTYVKGHEVTVADINAVVTPMLSAAVFDMTNALTKGDYDHASEVMGQLLQKQEEPIALLAAISREMRRIYTARLAIDGGKDKMWLMELWNMRSDYPARLLLDAARKTTAEWCAESLQLCRKLDRRMKSETGIDRESELKLLLMQLAQRK